MTRTAPPPLTTAPAVRAPSPWLRLLVLLAVGGGLASPLLVAAVLHWTADTTVAEEFLSALRDGDAVRVATLLTSEARGTTAGPVAPAAQIIQLCSRYLKGGTFSLGAPFRQNEILTVPFVLRFDDKAADAPAGRSGAAPSPLAAGRSEGTGEVVLRQAGGLWRVSRLHLTPQGFQKALEFDFERLAAEGTPNPPSLAALTTFDQVGPVTPDEFAAAWQTDLEAEDVPAAELLRALAREVGQLTVLPGGKLPEDVEEALGRRISLHLHKVSRFQAIEEVCRQVGVYPDYSAGQLLFLPGKRPFPIALAGPFLLIPQSMHEDAPNATGSLNLELYTAALPPKIEALFAAVPLSAAVRGVTGPAEQDLFFAQKGMPPGVANFHGTRAPGQFYVTPTPGWRPARFSVPLKNLLRDVEAISELRLSLRATLPREMHACRLEPVAIGGSVAAGGIRLTLVKITPPTPSSSASPTGLSRFEFRAEPPAGVRLCWQAHLVRGNLANGWASLAGRPEVPASVAGEPAWFRFKVWRTVQEVSWDFTLCNIPLARPPRRLEPLQLEGQAAPVRVSEARLTDKGVALRITNDCQKDVQEVDLKIAYRDGKGGVLGEARRKVGQAPGEGVDLVAPRRPEPLRPGLLPTRPEHKWRVQDGASVPAGTQAVTAVVTRALFKDGTTWAP
jgi:hypothetical protein